MNGGLIRPTEANGLAQLTYNGVTLEFLEVTSVDIEPVKDGTGTDTMYFNAKLAVEGLFFRDSATPWPFATSDIPAVVAMKARQLLGVPRRRFTLKMQNTVWLQSTPETQVAKGPEPGPAHFTELHDGAWNVSWSIVIPIIEAFPNDPTNFARPYIVGSNAGFGAAKDARSNPTQIGKRRDAKFNPIGSLRWKSTHSLDSRNYSTISYAGRMILRAPMENCHPDDFRALMTPRCPVGFIRQNAVYVIQEDGLAADWSHQDIEQPVMPPANSWKWSGQFVVSITKMCAMVNGAVSVHLEGAKGAKKSDLIKSATAICYQTLKARGLKTNRDVPNASAQTKRIVGLVLPKLGKLGAPGAYGAVVANRDPGNPDKTLVASYWITGGEIRDTLHDLCVDVLMQGALHRSASTVSGLPVDPTIYDTVIPEIDSGTGRAICPSLFGNVPGLKLWASLFGDTSLSRDWASPDPQADVPGGQPPPAPASAVPGQVNSLSTAPKPIVKTVLALPADPPTVYTTRFNDSDPGAYDDYELSVDYYFKSGRHMLPSTAQDLDTWAQQLTAPLPDASFLTTTDQRYLSQSLPVRLHATDVRVEMFFIARKMGGVPRIPVMDSADSNLVYLDGALKMGGVQLSLDSGSTAQRISGLYHYGVKDAGRLKILSPFFPWINMGALTEAQAGGPVFPTFDPLAGK